MSLKLRYDAPEVHGAFACDQDFSAYGPHGSEILTVGLARGIMSTGVAPLGGNGPTSVALGQRPMRHQHRARPSCVGPSLVGGRRVWTLMIARRRRKQNPQNSLRAFGPRPDSEDGEVPGVLRAD